MSLLFFDIEFILIFYEIVVHFNAQVSNQQ